MLSVNKFQTNDQPNYSVKNNPTSPTKNNELIFDMDKNGNSIVDENDFTENSEAEKNAVKKFFGQLWSDVVDQVKAELDNIRQIGQSQSDINPEMREKIQNEYNTDVISDLNYQIDDNGEPNEDFYKNIRISKMTSSGFNKSLSTNLAVKMQQGPEINRLMKNHAIYQDLITKNPDELTDGEKKFIANHETNMANFINLTVTE